MSEDQPSTFRIKKVGPDRPDGSFIIHYDPDEDILWVGLAGGTAGDEDLHSKGDILADPERNVALTINNDGPQPWFISSLALTNASRHPFWSELFRGLDSPPPLRKTILPNPARL